MGAIGEDGVRVLDREILQTSGVGAEEFRAVENREQSQLRKRVAQLRRGRQRIDLDGRVAVIVDDGLATGSSARAACQVARQLVSRAGDAAGLVVVLPSLLVSMWLARRGSLLGLLLWPGALFYALYTYSIYLGGAPFTVLVFGYVVLVIVSAATVLGIVAAVDGEQVRQRLAAAPVRAVGGALVVIAVMTYAGLIVTALSMLGSPPGELGFRAQWVVDCAVGTPVLLVGGALIWRYAPLGYVAAPGLLLVSGLGGVAFAVAGALDEPLNGQRTDWAVIEESSIPVDGRIQAAC